MFGLKFLLLFSFFINVLVSGQFPSMDDVMKRVLDRFEAQRDEDTRQNPSWDAYIDNLIAQSKDEGGTPNVDKACIIGLDGGAKWTTDNHPNALKLTQTERTHIASAFKSKNFSPFMNDGISAEGTNYRFLREEDAKKVYAKLKGHGALSLQTSKTAIVIAHCPEGMQQGNANKAVGIIAEYLESLGM
ncbi:profilin-like isoform X1 [Patiria miniata]|uniref:Profilin n=1 Tax=Patiria miniata TaxID=46514 RepID=A0A913ZP98_PATMI|nr:profilin-like isoform X1 [Patiria miniata]XP_038053200.1 profilin-like isoform X1 [Patiria miniata]